MHITAEFSWVHELNWTTQTEKRSQSTKSFTVSGYNLKYALVGEHAQTVIPKSVFCSRLWNIKNIWLLKTICDLNKMQGASWVAKTWLPCHDLAVIIPWSWKKMVLIMPWWRPCFLAWSSWFTAWSWYDYHVFHDSYHDHGMITMFSMIHTMIMVWSSCFPCFLNKNGLFVNVFSNSCCHIPLYTSLDFFNIKRNFWLELKDLKD